MNPALEAAEGCFPVKTGISLSPSSREQGNGLCLSKSWISAPTIGKPAHEKKPFCAFCAFFRQTMPCGIPEPKVPHQDGPFLQCRELHLWGYLSSPVAWII
jgi:hypothetical protein